MSLSRVTHVTAIHLILCDSYVGYLAVNDDRDILELLKAELAFLKKGGYRNGQRYPWRPNFAFEDSPTCLHYHEGSQSRPCTECALIQFVPGDRQSTRYPCRHIPLTTQGETVNSFYEWGTEEELEKALEAWLKRKIDELESETKRKSCGA